MYVAREVSEPFLGVLVRGRRRAHGSATPRTLAPRSGRSPPHAGPSTCSALVEEAVAQGAELRCGGPVSPPGCEGGSFYAPAVITGVTHEMRLLREPVDGPVLAVMTRRLGR